jgi:AcrR family transcriptional regulator
VPSFFSEPTGSFHFHLMQGLNQTVHLKTDTILFVSSEGCAETNTPASRNTVEGISTYIFFIASPFVFASPCNPVRHFVVERAKIEPIGSIRNNVPMGRAKNFSREGVLEKALPVFWKFGFADTSLKELEKATGVNKSGLYSEFADKGDLYLASLRHYLKKLQKEGLLTANPLGWKNVERFLKLAPRSMEGQKGCFSVDSMNQFAVLPPVTQEIVSKSRACLKDLIAKNVEAENPKMKPTVLADMILTFFTGISMEQHLKVSKASMNRKVDGFMKTVRKL